MSEYYRSNVRKDGLLGTCKKCCREVVRLKRERNRARGLIGIPASKKCNACGLEKASDCFSFDTGNTDGLSCSCRGCSSDRFDRNRRRNKERTEIAIPKSKVCSRCKQTKSGADFYPSPKEKDGRCSACSACMLKLSKEAKSVFSKRDTISYPEVRICRTCGEVKCSSMFAKCRSSKDGLVHHCKQCWMELGNKRRYGVPLGWYGLTIEAQKGGCAICSTDKPGGRGRFHIDHCHVTGKVRGLLCNNCNVGLGLLKESVDVVETAIKFLESSVVSDFDVLGRCCRVVTGDPTDKHYTDKLKLSTFQKKKMMEEQKGRCAICGIGLFVIDKVCVDHCHITGKVRGLLCDSCNSGIGRFGDSVDILKKAEIYIKKHQEDR